MPRFKFTFDLVANKTRVEEAASDAERHLPRPTLGGQVLCVADYDNFVEACIAIEAMYKGVLFGFNGSQQLKLPIDLDLGNVAYDGYCCASDDKSLITGALLPDWSDVQAPIQNAWREAALAVIRAAFPAEAEKHGG